MAVVYNNFTPCEIFSMNHVSFCGIELIKFLLSKDVLKRVKGFSCVAIYVLCSYQANGTALSESCFLQNS